MKPLLSIGITSYNRVKELERCITSIKTRFNEEIEVIVSEDCSPQSKEIGEAVERLKGVCPFRLEFMPNKHNLGYDRNLGAIIQKSQGKYVFLISDDDSHFEGFLDLLIPFLRGEDNNFGVVYSPFVYSEDKRVDRNYGQDMIVEAGETSCCKHIYDSILFSGLVFRKEFVEKYDAGGFLNMNYFQVYLFLKMLYHHGGYYFEHPSVWCVGDGENAYGISESSGGNDLLANRKSVISNLEFNKTLIRVIKIFDEEEQTSVFKSFEKQYSLHAYSGLSIARRRGLKYYRSYWNKLNSLGLRIYPIAKVYYVVLLILGADFTNALTSSVRKLVKHEKKIG